MKKFALVPEIYIIDTIQEFCDTFNPTETDLLVTNQYIYEPYFYNKDYKWHVIYQEKYGQGEPSDEMAEAIYEEIKNYDIKRIFAMGGGTIIDLCKFFALKDVSPIVNLYNGTTGIIKGKELIVIPTTCGTGSEVTNVAILELKSMQTKLGLAVPELYPDKAVLIPELLKGLPFKFFATSSIDALIHAVESYLSPKASVYTEMFSCKAIEMILKNYKKIAAEGEEARYGVLKDFLIASNYAGIAFGNAGTGAVHAMSYPLGGQYHVPHGESNYALFTGVLKMYKKKAPAGGKLEKINRFIAEILDCDLDSVYDELENLLNKILQKKPLREYGVKEEDLEKFTDNVMEKQGRLMANNYVTLTREDLLEIYKSLY